MKASIIIAAAAAASITSVVPASAQAPYVVGVTGAITGPAAGTYAPAIEAMRLYIDKVNANGGVNGRKINLLIQDDQGEASKGAANAKRFLTQDNALLVVNASLSTTFPPLIAEAGRAGVPVLFAGAACPAEVYPPAQSLLFCSTAYAAQLDSQGALDFIKSKSPANAKIGLAAMGIPISRAAIDFAEKRAPEMGLTTVEKVVVPPATPDFTSVASRLQQGQPDWVYSWAPWVVEVKVFEALRKIGWSGYYVTWATPEAEDELARLRDEKLFAVGAHAFFSDDSPVQREIVAAAKAGNATYPPNQMADGWIGGMVIEAALKAAKEATPKAVHDAMLNLTVDTKGLRGGPIEWNKDNHFRAKQYYRVFRWNSTKGGVEVVQDWKGYEVK
ncbi:MAG: ABC transporter substrate-binding protein [Bradyrhizobium sp.]